MVAKIDPQCNFFHSNTSHPLCPLVHGCLIGCVYQDVPRDSGVTVGVVRGATPPVRAALEVEMTSALPVSLAIT